MATETQINLAKFLGNLRLISKTINIPLISNFGEKYIYPLIGNATIQSTINMPLVPKLIALPVYQSPFYNVSKEKIGKNSKDVEAKAKRDFTLTLEKVKSQNTILVKDYGQKFVDILSQLRAQLPGILNSAGVKNPQEILVSFDKLIGEVKKVYNIDQTQSNT